MSRPLTEVDIDLLLDMVEKGLTQEQMAMELGMSIPTVARRICELQRDSGVLIKYRTFQSLQLTQIQARILDQITPEKIASATLSELVNAFKILKDKEQVIEGKPSEISGLVHYLIHMEKLDKTPKPVEGMIVQEEVVPESERMPNL